MNQHIAMSRLLKRVATLIIAAGIVCCLLYIADWSDKNLGLMVGLGLIIGGVQILLFGVIAPLLQRGHPETGPAADSAPALE